MKFLLLACLLGLMACGETVPPASQENQSEYTFDPKFLKGTESFDQIQSVCQALEYKEALLPEMARSYAQQAMDSKVTPCTGFERIEQNKSMVIERLDNGYFFAFAGDAGNFAPIPSVESRYTGEMAIFCNQRANLSSQVELANNNAVSITVPGDTGTCITDGNHVCVHLAKGLLDADKKKFTASEKHWIRFRTTGVRRGFYSERRKLLDCPAGGREEKLQSFR